MTRRILASYDGGNCDCNAIQMIIPKTTSPIFMNWFLSLRRGEIAVRRVIWDVINAMPFNLATKQQLAPYIQRENAQAQDVALRSASGVDWANKRKPKRKRSIYGASTT